MIWDNKNKVYRNCSSEYIVTHPPTNIFLCGKYPLGRDVNSHGKEGFLVFQKYKHGEMFLTKGFVSLTFQVSNTQVYQCKFKLPCFHKSRPHTK